MIETILGIILIVVFFPSNEIARDRDIESQESAENIELTAEQSPQSEDDCRFTDGPIPYRDLSDYVVLEAFSIALPDELNMEQSEETEPTDSKQLEDSQDESTGDRVKEEDNE